MLSSHSRRLVAAMAVAGINAGPVLAQTFSPPQREEIGRVVKEYLLQNPEVLQDAMNELQRRSSEAERTAQTAAIKELREELKTSAPGTVFGNPAGDVTLVEFFDYNCPYCKRSLADLQALLKSDPKLRVVIKDFPVLGAESLDASRVALAAKAQLSGDKLLDYHARLLGTRGRVNGERALAVARELGLDIPRVQKDAAGAEVRTALDANRRSGERIGINGTPAYVIGDEMVAGAVGLEPLREAVTAMRRCGHAAC